MPDDIETSIIANIPGFEDAANKGDTTEKVDTTKTNEGGTANANEGASTKQATSTKEAEQAKPNEGTKPNEATQASNANDGTKPNEQQQGNKRSDDSATTKPLIDPATGKVIVEGGTARRFYEREAVFNYHIVKRDLEKAQAENRVMQEALVSTRTYGLTPEEVITGQKMIAGWKKDPGATIKYLLTEAQKKGINIEGIGNEAQAAVIAELRNQNNNNTNKAPTQVDERVIYEQAETELRSFFIKHPDAELHQDLIAEVINKDVANAQREGRRSTINTEQAWYILRNEAVKRGLDLNRPLAEQLNATNTSNASRDNSAQQRVASSQQQTNKPLPNGRTNTVTNLVSTNEVKYADETVSFKDIIRGALDDVKTANGGNITL